MVSDESLRKPPRNPPARPAAEGIYAIVRHGDHTHLAYVIELPQRPRGRSQGSTFSGS